jgi:hypothetical protein
VTLERLKQSVRQSLDVLLQCAKRLLSKDTPNRQT